MRASYLVSYDIADEKRLRLVFKTMRGYGDHLQFSVFECQLTAADLARLKGELSDIIHHNRGPGAVRLPRPRRRPRRPRHHRLGKPYTSVDAPCIVV